LSTPFATVNPRKGCYAKKKKEFCGMGSFDETYESFKTRSRYILSKKASNKPKLY
jgi:hypothetical protein